MLISSNVDVLTGLLEEFRPCFSKPQFRNFSTYTLGLIACKGKKNIDAINRCFLDAKNQSSLNRFLTQSPWNLQKIDYHLKHVINFAFDDIVPNIFEGALKA